MKNPLFAVLLSAGIAASAAASRGRVQSVPLEGPAGRGGVVESGMGARTSAAEPGNAAPSLLPSSLPNPVSPAAFDDAAPASAAAAKMSRAAAVDPAAAVAAPAASVRGPVLAPKAGSVGLPASAIGSRSREPDLPGAFKRPAREDAANAADGGPEDAGARPAETVEARAANGNLLFDGARRIGASLLAPLSGAFHRLRRGWKGEDRIPGFPGQVGDALRIEGRPYFLDGALTAPPGQSLFVDRRASREPTLIRFYSAGQAGRYEVQRAALSELARTDIPHFRLRAAADENRVLVQDAFDENSAFALRPGKAMSYSQRMALPDLFYKLIGLGKTVDLSEGNLRWSHWRGHWAIADAESYEDGGAWDVLGPWLLGERARSHGADPVELLRALRGRYGPDSATWRRITAEGEGVAAAKELLDALGRRDAARPPPPSLTFEASPAPNEWLRDALVGESEMERRFGFSPLKAKGANLHFDPGKLNTRVAEIAPKTEGGPAWVRKISSREIVRNELFLRKVVHRWFGAYFDAPWALARDNGFDSYLMMEKAGGGHWGRGRFTGAQRVALAILMTTFGVSDVNSGNILRARDSKKPVLIDFEQALSRRGPVTHRIPDQGILTELPWVDTGGKVDPEDYHPGIAQWRALFAKPGTQSELRVMLRESGFTEEETGALLRRFKDNVRDLPYTLQADVEFAGYFHRDGR